MRCESNPMDYKLSNGMDSVGFDSPAVRFKLDVMGFANRLQWARERAGVTQREIAEHCGISSRTVSAWETGKADDILGENLYCVADFLRVSPRWLVTGKGTADDPDELRSEMADMTAEQIGAVRALISALKR